MRVSRDSCFKITYTCVHVKSVHSEVSMQSNSRIIRGQWPNINTWNIEMSWLAFKFHMIAFEEYDIGQIKEKRN